MPGGLKLDMSDLDDLLQTHAPHLLQPPNQPFSAVPSGSFQPTAPELGTGIAPPTMSHLGTPASIAKPTHSEDMQARTSQLRAGGPDSNFYRDQIAEAEDKKQNPWGSPDNHPGFLGKVAHGLARAGNIAGDILAPGTTALIPGTDLNNQAKERHAENELGQAETRETAKQRANTEQEGVEQRPDIAAATGEAKGRLEAQKEADAEKRQQTGLDSQESRAAEARKEQEAARADTATRQDKTFAQQEKLVGERESRSDARLDKTLAAKGGEKSAAESAAVERESRQAVRKAENEYRGAEAAANAQRDFVQEARSGNKAAVKIVPLQGALEITTSQGVHRINRNEIDQFAGAGSLFDHIQGKLGGALTGKDIPNDVLDDIDKLTKTVHQNAYKKYENEYNDSRDIVHGYGKEGFEQRVPKIPNPDAPQQSAPGGIQIIRDASGRITGVQ